MQQYGLQTKRRIVLAVMCALFYAALNQTVIGTITPHIVIDLGGIDHLSLVFTLFMLASTVATALVGRLSDMYGSTLFLIAGLVLLLIGSFLCGFSHNFLFLVTFRGVQGLGVGIIIAMSFTIVGELFVPRERGRWLGIVTSVYGIASIFGPVLGGYIADHAHWRWAFWLFLPFGAAALVFVALTLPSRRRANRLDIDNPIIPLQLFKSRTFTLASLIGLISSVCMFGTIMYAPLYIQGVLGMSAAMSGAMIMPLTLGLVSANAAAGWIVSRTGLYKKLALIGLTVMTIGMAGLSAVGLGTSAVYTVMCIAVFGIGLGVVLSVFTLISQSSVDRRLIGSATASFQLFRQLGATIGLSVMGTMLDQRLARSARETASVFDDGAESLSYALQGVFQIGLAASAIALLFGLFIIEVPLKSADYANE